MGHVKSYDFDLEFCKVHCLANQVEFVQSLKDICIDPPIVNECYSMKIIGLCSLNRSSWSVMFSIFR